MEDIELRNGRILRHLRRRCQQRGVRKIDLQALIDLADRVVPVGGGRVAITLTPRAAAMLRTEGVAASLLDRVSRLAAVVGENGDLITVVVPSGRRGRHYRRDVRRRRRQAHRH
jgi:hypothetical protein